MSNFSCRLQASRFYSILVFHIVLALSFNLISAEASDIGNSRFLPHTVEKGAKVFYITENSFWEVDLGFSFPYFETSYSKIFIGSNGLISFREGVSAPPLSNYLLLPKVMGYWTDLNTGTQFTSQITYFVTENSTQISKVLPYYFNSQKAIAVTWKNMALHAYRMQTCITFQIILLTDGIHSNVVFLYDKIELAKDTPSHEPVSGLTDNNGTAIYLHKQTSFPSMEYKLVNTGNSLENDPGYWIYWVESFSSFKSYQTPKVGTHSSVSTKVTGLLSQGEWFIENPKFNSNQKNVDNLNIICKYHSQPEFSFFGNAILDGSGSGVICPIPLIGYTDNIRATVVTQYNLHGRHITWTHKAILAVVKMDTLNPAANIALVNQTHLSATWNPKKLLLQSEKYLTVTSDKVHVIMYGYSGSTWSAHWYLTSSLENNGIYVGTFSLPSFHNKMDSSKFVIGISRQVRFENNSTVEKVMPINQLNLMTFLHSYEHISASSDFYDAKCKNWFRQEPEIMETNRRDSQTASVFGHEPVPCPVSLAQAKMDGRFVKDSVAASNLVTLNSTARHVYIQSAPSFSTLISTQCFYSSDGHPVFGSPFGHRYKRWVSSPQGTADWRFYSEDEALYMACCQWSSDKIENCADYYFEKRKPNFTMVEYMPPKYSMVFGTSRIWCFGGQSFYELNGIQGDFQLINYHNDISTFEENFSLQVQLSKIIGSNFTAVRGIVAEETNKDKRVKVEIGFVNNIKAVLNISENGVQQYSLFLHDDSFAEGYQLRNNLINIYKHSSSSLTLAFLTGFVVNVTWHSKQFGYLEVTAQANDALLSKSTGLMIHPLEPVLTDKTTFSANSAVDFAKQFQITKGESEFANANEEDNANSGDWQPWQPSAKQLHTVSPYVLDKCSGSLECVKDYVITNNLEFALATKQTSFGFLERAKVFEQEAIKCKYPNTIENATIKGSTYEVGNQIEINCADGLILVGTSNKTVSRKFTCEKTELENFVWKSTDSNETLSSRVRCATVPKVTATKSGFTVTPKIVPVFGNVPIFAKLPKISNNLVKALCVFREANKNEIETVGILSSTADYQVICPVPILSAYGLLRFELHLVYESNFKEVFTGFLYVERDQTPYFNKSADIDLQTITKESHFVFAWVSFDSFKKSVYYKQEFNFVCTSFVLFSFDGTRWKETCQFSNLSSLSSEVLTANINLQTMLDCLTKSPAVVFGVKETFLTAEGDNITSINFQHIKKSILQAHSFNQLTQNSSSLSLEHELECQDWYENDNGVSDSKMSCPSSLKQAKTDWRFFEENLLDANWVLFTQALPEKRGTGIECTYSANGTLSNFSHVQQHSVNYHKNIWDYYWHDALPLLQCCKWSMSTNRCQNLFFDKRPTVCAESYLPQTFAAITSTAKIFPFDGPPHRLQKLGEFWALIFENKISAHSRRSRSTSTFKMQILLEQYVDANNVTKEIPVVTSVAIMDAGGNEQTFTLQIWRNQSQLIAKTNKFSELILPVSEAHTYYFDRATLKFTNKMQTVLATFRSGFSVKICLAGKNELGLNVIVSGSLEKNHRSFGLLGSNPPEINTLNTSGINEDYMWMAPENETIFKYDPSRRDGIKLQSKKMVQVPVFLKSPLMRNSLDPAFEGFMDLFATGSEAVANSTKSLHEELKSLGNGK